MSCNQRLVDYFISEFYQFDVTDLSHLAASTFTFVINGGEPKLFDEFEKRRRYLFLNASIKHGEFSSPDGKSFYGSLEISTLEGAVAKGVIMFNVDEQLLQKVELNYDLTQEKFVEFFSYLFKDYDQFI